MASVAPGTPSVSPLANAGGRSGDARFASPRRAGPWIKKTARCAGCNRVVCYRRQRTVAARECFRGRSIFGCAFGERLRPGDRPFRLTVSAMEPRRLLLMSSGRCIARKSGGAIAADPLAAAPQRWSAAYSVRIGYGRWCVSVHHSFTGCLLLHMSSLCA